MCHACPPWEDKRHNSEYTPRLLSFPQLSLLSMRPRGMRYPFSQSGSAVLAVPLPASFVLPA